MRSYVKTLPAAVSRWTRIARALRWLDGAVAWTALWLTTAALLPEAGAAEAGLVSAVLVGAAAWVTPVRTRWRPVSACVGILVSARLRPGDQAWFVRPGQAELVLITGRRRLRAVIASGARGPAEGIVVRRTRVLLVPVRTG
jgi:hypothetical protein